MTNTKYHINTRLDDLQSLVNYEIDWDRFERNHVKDDFVTQKLTNSLNEVYMTMLAIVGEQSWNVES